MDTEKKTTIAGDGEANVFTTAGQLPPKIDPFLHSTLVTDADTMPLERIADPTQEAMMAEFERRKRARALTLPTDELEVKLLLRQLGEPICLFGEDKPDRRERLRAALSKMDPDDAHAILHKEEPASHRQKTEEETWYHEGSTQLYDARIFTAKYSLVRSQRRLAAARERQARATPTERAVRLQEAHKSVRSMGIYGSQVADTRPVAYCHFSPDSKKIAVACWSGMCKVFNVGGNCEVLRSYRGHVGSASCIRFHPHSASMSPDLLHAASSGFDGNVFLWSLDDDEPLSELSGHDDRVNRISFHPSGRFLGTTCWDKTWRLFDLEVNDEILCQEGHSKPVYDIDFQCDGSLALTGGLDGYARVWDLRSGRCIMFLEGHSRDILSCCWAPNGHDMATGGQDNVIKIWDLRVRRDIYTIPSHGSSVSRVCYEVANGGEFLISSSYDNTIKVWSNPGWQQLKVLRGHDSKVMCCDVSPDTKWIASGGYDRTLKLWAAPDVEQK